MNRFALIQEQAIAYIVEQDDAPTVEGQWVDVTGLHVGPGYRYDGTEFTVPAAQSAPRIITKLAFRNRFTDSEKVKLYTAAKTNVAVQIYLDDLQAASFINLALEKTRNGVQALEATGLLDVAGRAAAILDSPVRETLIYPG